jgi:hypothetical protein
MVMSLITQKKKHKKGAYIPLNPAIMQELNGPFFALRISTRKAKAP